MMSSGTCNTVVDDEKCVRHQGHPGDHFGEAAVLPAKELCGAKQSKHSLDSCKSEKGHAGRHSDPEQGVSWPQDAGPRTETFTLPPEPLPADASIPDSVRTRVRLHAAQTEYDLTVLRNRLDCMPTVTMLNKELRRKREQLTAELDAWTYLAGVAKRVD